MSFLNVNDWTVDQVVEWIAGLDPTICGYGPDFIRKQVNGGRLLNMMAGDLEGIGVLRVGDQLLLHDAIQSLRDEMEIDRITLQTLASNLCVRCKTYRSELIDLPKKNKIPTRSLSTAAYLLDASKTLVRWLTRYPFLGVIEYDDITKKLTRHCFELALLSQRDTFADNASEEVQYLCTKVIEVCDYLIHTKDLLAYQPAAVDIINIRKRHEQELGLQFETSYFGIHSVSGVVLNSPAQQSGGGTPHLERGDEILQVNYQTVVGWIQPNVISLLHENPCEVILTIKRRPRHASNSLGHMYLKPNRVPIRKLVSPVAEETAIEKDIGEKEQKKIGIVLQSVKEPTPNASNAEARFWKLYPTRPRGVLRRRATISGTSPISTRPPVTFIQDDNYAHKRRPPLDKSKSESNKLDLDDQSIKLFPGDSGKLMDITPTALRQRLENLSLTEPIPVLDAKRTSPTANSVNPNEVLIRDSQPSNKSNFGTGVPLYTGYLHERAHWKFGPRWNRHKAVLYSKLLMVGSHGFQISATEYQVAPAIEVHSRPFAFKLEKSRENQEKLVVYIAAESEAELGTWLKLLCKESGQVYPFQSGSHFDSGSGSGKFYRRSFSLNSTGAPEKPPRRNSLQTPKHELKLAPPPTRYYRIPQPIKTEITKLKSQSTSRLDERRISPAIGSLITSVPPPYVSSNISSITVSSSKRVDGGIQESTSRSSSRGMLITNSVSRTSLGASLPHLAQSQHTDVLSCSPFQMNLDNKVISYHPHYEIRNHHDAQNSLITKTAMLSVFSDPHSSKKSMMIRKDLNRNENLLSTSLANTNNMNGLTAPTLNNSICSQCGSRKMGKVKVLDASCQTDDNLFILIRSNHQSSIV